ncbi:glycosyltransferase family 2 protein [Vibrio breoganii]
MKLKAPVSEEDIMSHWIYTDKVYISCVCITFNQELYIRDAIDSFLAQVTEYKFEIVIHDDLSTDKTRTILKEYKFRYPSIIKLVLQKENQYSLGKKITPIAVSYAEGDYIALCEGDDFWNDCNKIDVQYKNMHGKTDISFHPCFYIDQRNGSVREKCNYYPINELISVNKVLRGGGEFMPTASLMIKKDVFDNLPSWFDNVPTGDFYLQVLASKEYRALYISGLRSSYRYYSVSSWTREKTNKSKVEIAGDIAKHVMYLNELERLFNSDIHEDCTYVLARIYNNAASLCLDNGYFTEYKEHIEKSWFYHRNFSRSQTLRYKLKRYPKTASYISRMVNGNLKIMKFFKG